MLAMIFMTMLASGAAADGALSGARLGQIALTVTDLDRARQFYGSVLGLPLAIDTGTMLFFDCGGTMLMLALPEENVAFSAEGSVVYFSVDAIEERWASLKKKGVDLVGEPHVVHRAGGRELWMAFFRDPDGRLLALMSWRE